MEELIDIDQDNATLLNDFNKTYLKHKWSPFISDAPSNKQIFKVYLYLNNARYEGSGSSKKKS